jgi:PAS domain S-box-containing protein
VICPHSGLSILDDAGNWIPFFKGPDTTALEPEDIFLRDVLDAGKVYQRSNGGPGFCAAVPLIPADNIRIGVLWVADKASKVLNDHQQRSFLLLSAQLMTYLEVERKNQELERSKMELGKFNDLFNYSNEIHCITDQEGKIKYINDSVHQLLGYMPAEVMNKTIWDFCAAGERERSMPVILAEIAAGKDRFQIETKTITKNGKIKWFEWSDVIKDGNWLVNGRDISRRKQAEMQAKVLTVAVEKSTAGVFIRNADNKVTWINEAMEHLTGYTLKELKGKVIAKLLVGQDTDISVFEYAVKMAQANESYKIEIKCYKKDGTPIWLFISNTPSFNEFGELERYVGVAFDITDRKEAEAQLIKTREDAINLSLAKENFLSVMSHELRTPLNGVIGASRLLVDAEHLEQQKETLNILQFSAQNLLTLINDVLDFTKIETGNMLLESELLDLRSLVDKTTHSFKPKALEQGIKLGYDFDARVPNFVYGDPTRLYQILVNLVGNAVKFTSKGYIDIQVALEEEREHDTVMKFTIKDTGIGIAYDKLENIFNAYTQAGAETSRKYGGTGLGLAITKKLVELHGSEIHVVSTLGEGTSFFFSIAFRKCDPSEVCEPAAPVVQEDLSGHVLVVDDSPMNRVIAQKILSRWKLSVDLAENGLEALEKIESTNYDLVLMDIHMPVMDGFEAVKNLRSRAEPKYQLLPVLALTGSVFLGHEHLIKEAGMNDYVLKPFDAALLYRKLKALLAPPEVSA